MTNPETTMRTHLRHATMAAHDRLHRHEGFAALLRGELSRPDYTSLLARLLGLHAPIEHRLARFAPSPWLAWHATGPSASRADRLRADLRALGMTAAEIAVLPGADAVLPDLQSEAAALGCAWVVEGSALGGRVMAQHVAGILGPGQDGGAFFAADAAQPARWRACCAAIDGCGADPVRRSDMVEGAVATFEAVEAWLGK